jgi:rhodanese-related sulfurtransferase
MKRVLVFLACAALLVSTQPAAAADPLPAGVKEITTTELKAMFDAREKYVLINSLSALEFTQTKIAGSVNLPYGQLRDGSAKLPADKDAKLVFYCLGVGCTKSPKSAALAVKQGYANVFVYNEGFPEWKKSGYPVEKIEGIVLNVEIPKLSAAELKGKLDRAEELTLLDIRDGEDRAVGVIKGSISIPLEELMSQFEKIPKSKPVVIACLKGKQGPLAGQYLVKQGYAKVSILENGVKDGWLAAGYPVEKPR